MSYSIRSAFTVLATLALAACGARTGVRDGVSDGAADVAVVTVRVRCPPDGDVLCAVGEACCASAGCPPRYACAPASTCPPLNFALSNRPGLGCNAASDCPGAECCATPFTNVTPAGICTAWTSGCRVGCFDATSAVNVPGGRRCEADGDCADLGRRCCHCRASPLGVCAADCAAEGCVNAP